MAKSVALSKRLKITKAQQNMFAAVAVAALILGVSIVFSVYFLRYIKFNSGIVKANDSALRSYSDAIKNIGICRAPSKGVYNKAEIESCDPNSADLLNDVQDSLRYNVLVNLAQNKALESVDRSGLSICNDPTTNKKKSYNDLLLDYRYSTNDSDRNRYLQAISMCSALRVVPDALPSQANALALGSSLNYIFKVSNYNPESITPGDIESSEMEGIGEIKLSLSVESDSDTTMRVLNNLEKSIREINIKSARIEIQSANRLKVTMDGAAYYTEKVNFADNIVNKTVSKDGKLKGGARKEDE